MAKYLSNINLVGNQLQNAVIHAASTAPEALSAGQIYYNTTSSRLFLNIDGTSGGWIDVSGDIKEIIAGAGLTGGGTSDAVTLNIGSGNGITVNANSIELSAEATQFEFVSGVLTISAGAIGSNELENTTVTAGDYGSSTEVPVFTVDADGRLTAASTAAISTTLGIEADNATSSVDLINESLIISGGANITTSVSGTEITVDLDPNITIGNLVVAGDLTVSGTTTTVNTETINLADNIITLNSNATGQATENAGIEIERGDNDNVSLFWDETADVWKFTYIQGPDVVEEVIPTTANVQSIIAAKEFAATISDTAPVTHNLGSLDVIVQLYDVVTLETVYADVVRTDINTVDIAFGNTPVNNIRVLINKIG